MVQVTDAVLGGPESVGLVDDELQDRNLLSQSQISPLVLEASSQWDKGTRAVSGSSHAGYGTIRTTARLFLHAPLVRL